MIKSTLGKTLREWRERQQLTQEKLALASGVSYRFYQDIEGGKQQPTMTTLFKLAKALNTTPGEILLPVWNDWLATEADDEFASGGLSAVAEGSVKYDTGGDSGKG